MRSAPARLNLLILLLTAVFALATASSAGARHDRSRADVTGSITLGGAPVSVTIGTAGDNARLTFDGTAQHRVFVKFTSVTIGTSSCCSTLVSILKPDGTALTSAKFIGTSGGYIDTAVLPATGAYTIFLDPQGTATGSATLTAYDVPADPAPLLQPSQAGDAATLTTTVPGQNITPTFNGTAGQRIFVKLSGVSIGTSSCCSFLANLRKPDGSNLTSAKYIGTSGGYIDTATLPTTGTYTIFLDPDGSSTGSLTVTAYDVPPDPAPLMDLSDDASWVTLEAAVPGQNVAPTFSGTAGQRVFVNLPDNGIGTSSCCSALVSIKKPDGSSLTSVKYVGTSGGYIDTATLPTTGTYTIFIDPDASSTGSIAIELNEVPADATGSVIIGGTPATVSAEVPGQDMSVTFEGSAGQAVRVTMAGVALGSSSCCAMLVSIKKPDGSTLASPAYFGTSGGNIDRTLPVAGVYTIFVNPDGPTTGSAILSVSLTGAPASTAAPAISGTPANGELLSASTGTWSGSPTSFAYQWQRCDLVCENVVDADVQTYTLSDEDVPSAMRVVVSAANSAGTASATSPSTVEVSGARVAAPKWTRSFYVATTNPTTWWNLGCDLGENVTAGVRPRNAVVFLNFGRPYYSSSVKRYGTITYISDDPFRSTRTIRLNVIQQYASGYWSCSPLKTKLTVVAATSNFGSEVTRSHGVAWANMVDAANAYFRNQTSISSQAKAYGGSDVELSWNGPTVTRRWVGGYLVAGSYPYYVDGDAAGCPPAGGQCNGSWSYEDMYYVNWDNKFAWPVPQIYREDGINADQWQRLSAFGYTAHSGAKIGFQGSMTTYWGCIDNGLSCGHDTSGTGDDTKNHPNDGWRQLYNALNSSAQTRVNLPHSTDVRWHADEN
jgi:hypothetical protein